LAKRAKERLSDAIFSSDSDFAAHLGDDGLFVKDFSFHSQEQTFSDIVLSATGLRSLNKWIADIKISRPKFPIFQSLKDPMIRALAAVAIGCDVWPGGIKGVGVSKVFKVIQEFSEKPPKDGPAEALAAQLVKCRSSALIDPQVLICFAKAFMYEKSSGGYVHNRPTSLEEYLSDFGDEQTAITKFLPTKTCVGLGCDSQHCFLAAEGFSFCSSCKQIICCHCAGDIRDPGSVLCFPCFRGESVGDEDSVSETEMRSALKQHHVSCPAAASYAEVLDLYSQWVVESKYDIFDDAIKKVKYPLLPTRVLEPSELQLGGPISFIKKLKVAELGFHMQDQTLAMERIQSVVSLLSSLVDFRKEETAMMGLPSAIQGVMPSLIVNFANGARVHSGLRLMKRAVRHAIDPVTPDIMDATLKLCEYKGEMVFVLIHKVKASMRKSVYNTEVAFTKSDLLACGCSCRCGSEKEECVLDVHPLALVYELVLLLFEGLAQNILVELCSRLRSEDPAVMCATSGPFRSDLIKLMTAAGKQVARVTPAVLGSC